MSETDQQDPVAGFAQMMSKAAEKAADEAPYGFTKDRETGEVRPKRTAGRPRKSPSIDELREAKAQEEAAGAARGTDREPDSRAHKDKTGERSDKSPARPDSWHEGQIARGINKLYRRAGKIVRVMDPDIGTALIEITRKEDPEDLTVGEAWEDLARGNPRIRKFLLKVIAGGVYGQLFWAHAPVLLAVLMKDAVRERIPFGKLMAAFLADEGDGDGAPAEGTPFDGMTMPDMAQMQAVAAQMAADFMNGRAAPGAPRPPVAPAGTTAAPAGNGS